MRNPGAINMDIVNTETLSVSALGGDDQITANAGLLGLIAMIVDAGAGADTINSTASVSLTVDGNTEVDDTLNFDAEQQTVSQTTSTIAVAGQTRVTHTRVENINITNTAGWRPTITITSPTADPATTSTSPFITLGRDGRRQRGRDRRDVGQRPRQLAAPRRARRAGRPRTSRSSAEPTSSPSRRVTRPAT